jgi:hypothetical protein
MMGCSRQVAALGRGTFMKSPRMHLQGKYSSEHYIRGRAWSTRSSAIGADHAKKARRLEIGPGFVDSREGGSGVFPRHGTYGIGPTGGRSECLNS